MSEQPSNSTVESPPEVRAFIYQQLSDIQMMLPEGSEIAVTVTPSELDKACTEARIEIETPEGMIYSYAKNKDQFDAIVAAKSDIEIQLKIMEETYYSDDEETRDDIVDAIIEKRYLH